MKKLLLLLVASLTMLFVGCSQFDDSRIWDAIDELEEEQEKMQEQIDAQQTLLNALANNLSIISITPTAEGFLLTFSDGSTITVKHGEKGDKGDTGEKGEQGEKGDKGDTGEKGEDGADGKDGQDGKDGADGDSLFQSVTWDEEYAYFTLSDGTVIKIPLASDSEAEEGDLPPANEIWYTSTDGEVVTPYNAVAFGVNILSNTYENGVGIITFDGYVTSIGDEAFAVCSSLASVTIPNSVTSIGVYAFAGCSSLASVIIPDSVTWIGDSAFGECESLASVTIPDSVTSIGYSAFYNCSSLAEFRGKFASSDGRCLIIDGVLNSFAPAGLTEYTIPDSVTSIGEGAFYGCSSLASVTIPDSVTSIGDYAFAGCSSLASVTIQDSVTSIGDEAFRYCYSLTSVTIPDSVTSIGEGAFRYCSSLASVTIPDSVTSIGEGAFRYCSSLASVTIQDSVTSIGDYAFDGCSSLASVTIPDSVTSIREYAFYDCTSLTSVYCKPTTPPSGDWYMFDNNASGRKIYVPTESVEAYKAAEYWSVYADDIVGYDFENGGSDITQMVEVEAVYMIGLWSEDEGDYVTGFFICDKPWQDEGPANDSRTYGLSVWSKTAPVDDEIPHGTYNLGDTLGAFNGVEYIYTSNNGSEQCMYTDGIVVVGEGKIEATLTLENGEVHHVVYEGSLTTLGEGEIGG